MRQKKKIKFAVKKAMLSYYKSGMTNTAHIVYKEVIKAIDKCFDPK